MIAKAKVHNPKTDGIAETYDGTFREFSEEQIGLRVIEVDDRKFNVVQENPFQLWRVVPEKGRVPTVLNGLYTSVELATNDIERYVNSNKK